MKRRIGAQSRRENMGTYNLGLEHPVDPDVAPVAMTIVRPRISWPLSSRTT
jgi:hypothetical protein